MALTDISELPRGRVVVDSAPIIYLLEDDAVFAPRFAPFFERAEAGGHELVISTLTLAEVLTGPLRTGNERLAERYRRRPDDPTHLALGGANRRHCASRRSDSCALQAAAAGRRAGCHRAGNLKYRRGHARP